MNIIFQKIKHAAQQSPRWWDLLVCCLLATALCWQPFYLEGDLNLFELSLYLPTIHAMADGALLYRDVLYLRSPLEILVPFWMLQTFGDTVAVLMTYFYAGSVLTILVTLWIARWILHSRLFLYLLTLVLTARTFPRVVFTYWGGLRFVLGLLAVGAAIRFFQTRQRGWIIFSAVASSLAMWTSVDIGVFSLLAVLAGFAFVAVQERERAETRCRGVSLFLITSVGIHAAWIIGMWIQGNLGAYVETLWIVTSRMGGVFPQDQVAPDNFFKILLTMVAPTSKNFRHITPLYCYLFVILFWIWQRKRDSKSGPNADMVVLFVYGLVFYFGILRNVWSTHFEMALQPEKILLFWLLERWMMRSEPWVRGPVGRERIRMICLAVMIIGSVGYAVDRYNKRFPGFQTARNRLIGESLEELRPVAAADRAQSSLPAARGLVLSSAQAVDMDQLAGYVKEWTSPEDPILVFPEWGVFHYLLDRPFSGRFPVVKLAWFDDAWHAEMMRDLEMHPPVLAIRPRELPEYFPRTHFLGPGNRVKFDHVQDWIESEYVILGQTPGFEVWIHKIRM